MGAHGGGSLGASPSSFQVLKGNIDGLAKKYPLDSENRFGTKVSAKTSEVYTGTPLRTAEEFWKALSKGGTVRDIDTKNNIENLARMPEQSLRPSWRQVR